MRVVIFDRMDECTEKEVQRLLPLVSAQRREQALRYKHTFGRFCCLKSWVLLSMGVAHPIKPGNNPDLIMREFRYNEHGKPYLEGGPYFSISHCKEGIAVAVDDQPIGIDIESIRHTDEELIKRTMNEEEQEEIRKSGDRAFTRLWTQKEAVVKAQGVGIYSFEQLQTLLEKSGEWRVESVEREKYIYSIAHK